MIARRLLGPARVTHSRLGRRLAALAIASLSLYALLGATSVSLAAEDKVDICHATGSESHPYEVNHPDASGDLGGHLGHTGPIWYPGAKADDVVWGDIIPPIPGIIPDGLNWSDEGQAIHENDCNIPTPPPPAPDEPDINVEKSADPTNLDSGGGSVTYTYEVTNTGNVPLSDVTIGDDTCAPITGPSGDANTNDLLDLTETWTYTCTMDVTVTTTNVVVVEGTSGEDTVSDTDEATVTVGQELPATGTPSPSPSLPSTSTIDAPGQGGGGAPIALLVLLLAAGAAGLAVLDPSSIKIRK